MLYLKQETVEALERMAGNAVPNEACGMVTAGLGGEAVVWLRNVAKEPRKYYEVDPDGLAEAFRVMDAMGNVPVAYYHSHPGGKPDPSEADMAGALNVGMHYLIVSWVAGVHCWHVTAWECVAQGVLVTDELTVVP